MKVVFFAVVVALTVNFTCIYSGKAFHIDNFRPRGMTGGLKAQEATPALPASSWSYLGHGKQAIVFATDTHVLKLFYVKRPLHKGWQRHIESWLRLASPHFPYALYKRRKEYQALLGSYRLAFEKIPKETGLVLAHLAPTKERLLVSLKDREGQVHHVDLAPIPFVIQERARLAPEVLRERGAPAIESLKALLQTRHNQGLIDRNQVFQKNYGFVGDRAIQLDPGRLVQDPQRAEKEGERSLQRLHKYLTKRNLI